jgi:hypothetical protein
MTGEQAAAAFSDALPLSYRNFHSGRDSNPQPAAYEVSATYATGAIDLSVRVMNKALPFAANDLSQRQNKQRLANSAEVSPREQTKTGLYRFQTMNLAYTPLGKIQCVCALRRRQTPADYWKLTNHARRPMQLCPSRSSLRIELCVVYLIGRSPTQMLLCHNST